VDKKIRKVVCHQRKSNDSGRETKVRRCEVEQREQTPHNMYDMKSCYPLT